MPPLLRRIAVAVAYITIAISMLVRTAESFRVAVLGSGIAGSTAARKLAEKGAKVTVFEAGFGVGGRTSTRIARDEPRYQFDHGAQYIGSPKTEEFRECLEDWKSGGFVKEWEGAFAAETATGEQESVAVVEETKKKERWVGFPCMNSICGSLLDHENIQVKCQTRAHASPTAGKTKDNINEATKAGFWRLQHGKTKEDLGTFDWLVVTDRNSGVNRRNDLPSSCVNIEEFTTGIRDIQSIKSLTAMVVFARPLEFLTFDGIQFTGKDDRFGSLGWIARDTSKPGRERNDGKECWVLQSHPDAAKKLLKGKYKIGEIRDMARDVLVGDFLNSLPHLTKEGAADDKLEIPSVVYSVGHRWGAAFPIPSPEYSAMDCKVVANERFVACGDYFGKLSGRIEGAYLSGRSAADEIIRLNAEIMVTA